MQRHRGLYRDMDGAVEWNRWFQTFCRCHSDAPRWTNQMWIDHLHRGSNKKRFQCCLNSDIFTLSTRAIQGHSGETTLNFYCWLTCKLRALGISTSITLVLLLICFLQSNQDGLQEERIRKKEDKRYSSQP